MSRTRLTALVLAGLVFLGGGAAVRAQSPPSGRVVALSLVERCPEKTKTFFARSGIQSVAGRWITVTGPVFTPEAETFGARPAILAHSVDPADPSRQLVSDGNEIHRTTDAGCTWQEVHEVSSSVSVTGNNELLIGERIRQLEQVVDNGQTRRAWALMAPQQDGIGAVRVLISDNGGVDWSERSAGLPAAHSRFDSELDCPQGPCVAARMAVAPSDPDVAYVVVNRQTSADFFRTTDAGRTWVNVFNPLNLSTQGYFGFEVSPLDPMNVWIVSQGRLSSSDDGGTTWTSHLDQQVSGLHLGATGGQLTIQVMEETDFSVYGALVRSVDGGRSFVRTDLPETFQGYPTIAQGGHPDQLTATTDEPDTVLRFDPADLTFDSLAVDGLGDVNAPRLDRTGEPAIWFRQFADLAVFLPGPVPEDEIPPPPPLPPRPDFDGVGGRILEAGRVPGVLSPDGLARDIGPEGSLDVGYRLDLPALPTPVDIWFLMDTSGSMGGAHEGLREGIRRIIDELEQAGIDAWYGLAIFPSRQIYYDRLVDLGPPGEDLFSALEMLTTDGQTTEMHPTALYQSVTGEGQEDAGIPPGRGASFRANALKIIVHATDEPYGDDPLGPSRQDAADALSAAGVRHVGLDLSDGATAPGPAGEVLSVTKRDHDFMATETGTFAPAEGIDCNGDGTLELREGDPVTCPINRYLDRTVIGPTIVAAIKGVRDETTVALEVPDQAGIQVAVDRPSVSPVNLKRANSVPFGVRFTCPPEMTGRVANVVLQATVRGAPSGSARARIGCGAPVVAPPVAPRPLAAAVPLVVSPPQIVPNIEPGISPLQQPAPSQVAAPSAQPGLAAQPGELQTAKQRSGSTGSPVPPAESGSGEPSPSSVGATLAAGAALAMGAGGWATRRERAQSPARRRA